MDGPHAGDLPAAARRAGHRVPAMPLERPATHETASHSPLDRSAHRFIQLFIVSSSSLLLSGGPRVTARAT